MKKRTYSLSFLFVLVSLIATAQTAVPTVPEQVTFSNISVRLDADARRIIQQDVNALLANRQYWTAKLDRVVLYFPMIEAILIDEDVPTDFKYLAVQESSLTPDAVSSSDAVGYWQFKRETALDYGLRVDNEIDERKSITASTRGAAKYIKKSNTQFNNWVSSLYSYYLGAGGISKLIPPDWSYAREVQLDGRTDRYILRFFAHKIAIEHALQTHQTTNRFALIEYPNGGGKSMRAIAEELSVEEFELRKYNRWILGEGVPTDKTYVMAIPVVSNQINDVRQKIVNVNTKKASEVGQTDVGFPVLRRVTTGKSSPTEPVLYEINGLPGIQAQAGDNAASLARKSKISLSGFLRYNDMDERDPVLTGDVYYLAKKRKKALVPFHTVREDETARSISQRYGIRLKKLMRFNRLDRVQKLATGRVMWLRERRPSNKPVEIITAPTPPTYDQTPTQPNRRPTDVAMNSGTGRPVTGSEGVPRNSSERKLYQPKLVGGGITPNDGTSEPAAPQPTSQPRTQPSAPAPTPVQVQTPAPATTRTVLPSDNTPTTTSRTTNSDGSQRVVIVRTPEATAEPTKTETSPATPVAATPGPATTGSFTPARPQTPERKIEDTDLQPAVVASKAEPRVEAKPVPAAIEKSPSAVVTTRPSTPSVPTPAPTEVVKAEPKVVAPVVRPTASASTGSRGATMHTVEPGQTYYSISRLHGLTVDQLMALNNLTAANVLEVGQELIVKAPAATKTSSATNEVVPARTPAKVSQPVRSGATEGAVTYHTVAKGETMYRVSKMYNVSIEQIQAWNNLTDVTVREGQRIKIVK